MIMINYQYNDVNENRSFNNQKATYKSQLCDCARSFSSLHHAIVFIISDIKYIIFSKKTLRYNYVKIHQMHEIALLFKIFSVEHTPVTFRQYSSGLY